MESANGALRVGCPFTVETYVSGLDQPADFATCGTKLFVAEKKGRIRVVVDGKLRLAPVLDITSIVNDYWDRGLLGVALDPRNCESRPTYLYVIHTFENRNGYTNVKTSRIARYTLTEGDYADPKSQYILIDKIPSDSYTHSAGTVRVDTDGYVWATHGDGINPGHRGRLQERAMDLNVAAGKMFKIRPDGAGVATNPFYEPRNPNSIRSKVWAYGLRNPFRFNHKPGVKNAPIGGDVGQYKFEELNVYRKGFNFGWPCFEGNAPYNLIQPVSPFCRNFVKSPPASNMFPLSVQTHNYGGIAIIGGDFATAYGSCHKDRYFYGTYGFSSIQALPTNAGLGCNGNCFSSMIVRGAKYLTAVNRGPYGYIYFTDILNGRIRRLRSVMGEDTPCLVSPPAGTYPISQWWWSNEPLNGRGQVEVDMSVGERMFNDGKTMLIKGRKFFTGLGVAAPSEVKYFLGGRCMKLTGYVGADDSRKSGGSVTFSVVGDMTTLWTSPAITYGSDAVAFTVSLTGRATVALKVAAIGGGGGISADWADLFITCDCPAGGGIGEESDNQQNNLKATILYPKTGYKFVPGKGRIEYKGLVYTKTGGVLEERNYTWQINLKHCVDWTYKDCHYHFVQELRGRNVGSFPIPTHEDAWYLELTLIGDDRLGNRGEVTSLLYPK